jgi:hypothetical protein
MILITIIPFLLQCYWLTIYVYWIADILSCELAHFTGHFVLLATGISATRARFRIRYVVITERDVV